MSFLTMQAVKQQTLLILLRYTNIIVDGSPNCICSSVCRWPGNLESAGLALAGEIGS